MDTVTSPACTQTNLIAIENPEITSNPLLSSYDTLLFVSDKVPTDGIQNHLARHHISFITVKSAGVILSFSVI